MELSISHDRGEESPEAKARWFKSLSVKERMDYFVMFTDFILSVNPGIADTHDVEPVEGRIRVLRAP